VTPTTSILGDSGLEVFRFCLGGNVFGWTADEETSFAVLDAYAAAGGNFIDTADVYSAWVPGNKGGESEKLIGRWMAARGNRHRMIVATKVGMAPGLKGLSAATIHTAASASLRRLGTDYIDLYYAHADDAETPLRDSLGAFDTLVKQGKVRFIAASNYTAARLSEALAVSATEGLAEYVALQPHYNLVHREEYEGELREVCVRERISCIPYYALASGFLTGKYRDGAGVQSARSQGAGKYLDARGRQVLALLDQIAAAHSTTVPAVALAWLMAQPMVAAPIASARTVEQLSALLPAVTLALSSSELEQLSA
jgi:aryl-alcohol dehydrogenase-like predicted oxidoreductase